MLNFYIQVSHGELEDEVVAKNVGGAIELCEYHIGDMELERARLDYVV